MLEYKEKKVILGADAQWESWGKMTEEFPHIEKTTNPMQHIKVDESYYPLDCDFFKVSHHGSKHGTALEAIEKVKPNIAVISCGKPSEYDFPHDLATGAIKEVTKNIYETHTGSVAYAIHGDGKTEVDSLLEANKANPPGPIRHAGKKP